MTVAAILLAGMVGLFILAFGYTLIFVVYQRRLIAKDLEQQKLENHHQKELLQSSIESQEVERKRIAHDLHDEIGALLTTSRFYFNQLHDDNGGEQFHYARSKIDLLFDEMLTNVRRIAHDLRPVVLENLGLAEALEGLRFAVGQAGVCFDFTCQLSITMTKGAELMLYRIIQELVSNTLKHAHAKQIRLDLETDHDEFCMRYSDDGVGFGENSDMLHGLGLKSIASRLSILGGDMKITKPEKGVRFLIHINTHKLSEYGRNQNSHRR